MSDYDRFKRDHPEMLKMAEEHLEETERMAAEITRLREAIENAPHFGPCENDAARQAYGCNCWKATALGKEKK